ncbi:hypothetical protein Lalb_Chr06g0164281 [Lupinus albus]|uniref:Uncharacterized protein n=1 Tax=Lupinus albus TaxID=3870 RepID=A0A6A4QDF3_LUPAL|nr:hypothetical protein Lalb_Chr06g0164281 [Lupinus albus]
MTEIESPTKTYLACDITYLVSHLDDTVSCLHLQHAFQPLRDSSLWKIC